MRLLIGHCIMKWHLHSWVGHRSRDLQLCVATVDKYWEGLSCVGSGSSSVCKAL
jgi:hypothetical protein